MYTELIQLAERNRWTEFISKVRLNPEIVKYQDKYNSNLLIEIIDYADIEIIGELVKLGSDINLVNGEGFSCIHKLLEGCASTNTEKLKYFISLGADVEVVGWNGWTPLHQAVTYCCVQHVQLLIDMGANVNAKTKSFDEETPLMIARRKGFKEIQNIIDSAK
ncbi:MAG: ankyrin repeat domain-containing protein [Candidatus Thiodiazotropha sp. (ex Dulcina madagascariensis)]|nr:ankyrin repeat domain-containing protein [Candidatus Thiodiazotropha sp. (ex Dulcina madagascariensis)]